MSVLTRYEAEDIIQRLTNGEAIPEDYKYKLFPVKHKEYELIYGGKMRREDILANEDGVFPLPIQIEKIYNGSRIQWPDGWKNIIGFGDNLQFLKTLHENVDPLIKNKVKGKVKLIYIDPPFATEGDFKSNQGQKAYTDKAKGADFIEFIRRRLIVANELLSADGCICVHLDFRYKHHIKIVMDEIFGEHNFKNEIIANRTKKNVKERVKVKKLNEEFDTILMYAKSDEFQILPPTRNDYKADRWHGFDAAGFRNGMDYELFGRVPARTSHWRWTPEKTNEGIKNYQIWEKEFSATEELGEYYRRKLLEGTDLQFVRPKPSSGNPEYFIPASDSSLCNNMWNDINVSSFENNYPTEKNERLLKRIIEAVTDEGDLVLDFFGGSGTTIATAEKLNRKWITCDVGKLAFYTIQRRLLNIQSSKSLSDPKKAYNNLAKSFITVNSGQYDLAKVFELQHREYCEFVMKLFEVTNKKKTINGIQIDGERKDGYNVIIWPFWKFTDSSIDEDYLNDLYSHIGAKAGKRIYIVAPANYVAFFSDYHLINDIRYYFLKVPYQVIKELHKVEFKKFRQPQSKKNINDLDNAVGFHFIRQPEVKSEIATLQDNYVITIKSFHSSFSEENTNEEMANFESLSMVLIDKDFNGSEFDMDEYFFVGDLLPKNKKKQVEEDNGENMLVVLKELDHISLPKIPKSECGDQIMVVYVDIYGNEFKEVFKTN